MAYGSLHAMSGAGRRGDSLPGRLRLSARRGVTLVELLISMLILAIVCIAWLQIIGIQSARKEARRREAVERLVGMMDAFLYVNRRGGVDSGSYRMLMANDGERVSFVQDDGTNAVHRVFDGDVSPIGYQLRLVNMVDVPHGELFSGWTPYGRGASCRWLVGSLYERSGEVDDAGSRFFCLPVCMGF